MKNSEPIPGMSDRIRETLKRRVDGDVEIVRRIDALTADEIYEEAPASTVDRVVREAPTDPGDFRQWVNYRDAAERNFPPKEINKWVRNVQRAHGLNPRQRGGPGSQLRGVDE